MRGLAASAVIVTAFLGLSSPAQAYVDLGTGSMMVQLLIGAATGVLVAGKLYWQKIKDVFMRRPGEADPKPEE
ncbi:MAG: hypothetical protein QGI13_00935 [Rhodospirillales bacterium]|jgi:hypothetical protein|nr:hypothetical protein [Rhodospirillales bacterium]